MIVCVSSQQRSWPKENAIPCLGNTNCNAQAYFQLHRNRLDLFLTVCSD